MTGFANPEGRAALQLTDVQSEMSVYFRLRAVPALRRIQGYYSNTFSNKSQEEKAKIGHIEGFRQIQVFCFRFDNCNNAILVYAYVLIYYRLAVVSGCVKVVV